MVFSPVPVPSPAALLLCGITCTVLSVTQGKQMQLLLHIQLCFLPGAGLTGTGDVYLSAGTACPELKGCNKWYESYCAAAVTAQEDKTPLLVLSCCCC
jgi:hypothetical protein